MKTRADVLLSCPALPWLSHVLLPWRRDAVTSALIQSPWQTNIQEFFDMLALPNDSIQSRRHPQEC